MQVYGALLSGYHIPVTRQTHIQAERDHSTLTFLLNS